jgi:hypothetical protein
MKGSAKQTLAIAALVLVLAAGAGTFLALRSDSSANAAQTGLPSLTQQGGRQQGGGGQANSAAFQQFRQCMVDNGVTLSAGQRPDPTDPTVQKARQACAQYAPQRGSGGNGFGSSPNGAATPGGTQS